MATTSAVSSTSWWTSISRDQDKQITKESWQDSETRTYLSTLPVIGALMYVSNQSRANALIGDLKDQQLAKIKAGNADPGSVVQSRIDLIRQKYHGLLSISNMGNLVLLVGFVAKGVLVLNPWTSGLIVLTACFSLYEYKNVEKVLTAELMPSKFYTNTRMKLSILPILGTAMLFANFIRDRYLEEKVKDDQLKKIKAGNPHPPSQVRAEVYHLRQKHYDLHSISAMGTLVLIIGAIAKGVLVLNPWTQALITVLSLSALYNRDNRARIEDRINKNTTAAYTIPRIVASILPALGTMMFIVNTIKDKAALERLKNTRGQINVDERDLSEKRFALHAICNMGNIALLAAAVAKGILLLNPLTYTLMGVTGCFALYEARRNIAKVFTIQLIPPKHD